jgi:hypothetical protein
VRIYESLDGAIAIYHRDQKLNFTEG